METISISEKQIILNGWFKTWQMICDESGAILNTQSGDSKGYLVSNGVLKLSIKKFGDGTFYLTAAASQFRINEDAANQFIYYFNERVEIRNRETKQQMDYTDVYLIKPL